MENEDYDVPAQGVGKEGAECGAGTYGVVYKARDKETGKLVVLKKIKLDVADEGVPSTSLREISILRMLKHPNIVQLNAYLVSDAKLYLVFEFIDQDLKKYMSKCSGPLSTELIQSYTHQMLEGLYFCHSHGVMHRWGSVTCIYCPDMYSDLKPQNILVSRDGSLKLADFGLARSFVPPIRPLTHEVVTLWYRAPEILLGCKIYALPVDLWAVGVIVAEMAIPNKRSLFPGDSEYGQLIHIFSLLGTPNATTIDQMRDFEGQFPDFIPMKLTTKIPPFSDAGLDLIEKLLVLDPKQRLTAQEALRHPFLTSR